MNQQSVNEVCLQWIKHRTLPCKFHHFCLLGSGKKTPTEIPSTLREVSPPIFPNSSHNKEDLVLLSFLHMAGEDTGDHKTAYQAVYQVTGVEEVLILLKPVVNCHSTQWSTNVCNCFAQWQGSSEAAEADVKKIYCMCASWATSTMEGIKTASSCMFGFQVLLYTHVYECKKNTNANS